MNTTVEKIAALERQKATCRAMRELAEIPDVVITITINDPDMTLTHRVADQKSAENFFMYEGWHIEEQIKLLRDAEKAPVVEDVTPAPVVEETVQDPFPIPDALAPKTNTGDELFF